jgi:Spy/CpxP family protein refolding chaperone
MDWVTQHKFRNWLIVILLVSNLLTVSIIWMQTTRTGGPEPKERKPRASESVQLMRKALDLTEEQALRFEAIRDVQVEQSRAYNDRLSMLKRQLAEALFDEKPDTLLAKQRAAEIGELQSKVETIRFEYFSKLLTLCTPEQREKLKPIVIELFGRKPPKDDSVEKQPRGSRENPPSDALENAPRDKQMREPAGENSPRGSGDKPRPPSTDERLARYSERLGLTDDQTTMIRTVMLAAKQKEDELRTRVDPDPRDIEGLKERIRQEEDDGIMKLLTADQRTAFAEMIAKRRR